MGKRTANSDGTIPGTPIDRLAEEVRAYVCIGELESRQRDQALAFIAER
ncbi:MAG: hypothetical protein KDN22_17945 [Verrucomicrobiae bacterium]|nr:hypothetical protein [Verrucomicrobiae bacterium]